MEESDMCVVCYSDWVEPNCKPGGHCQRQHPSGKDCRDEFPAPALSEILREVPDLKEDERSENRQRAASSCASQSRAPF